MSSQTQIVTLEALMGLDAGTGPVSFTHELPPLEAGKRYPLRSLIGMDGLRVWSLDDQGALTAEFADGARARAHITDTQVQTECSCAHLGCPHGLAATYVALATGPAPGWASEGKLSAVRGNLGHYLGAREDFIGLLACVVSMRGLLSEAPLIRWRRADRTRPIPGRSARAALFGR